MAKFNVSKFWIVPAVALVAAAAVAPRAVAKHESTVASAKTTFAVASIAPNHLHTWFG